MLLNVSWGYKVVFFTGTTNFKESSYGFYSRTAGINLPLQSMDQMFNSFPLKPFFAVHPVHPPKKHRRWAPLKLEFVWDCRMEFLCGALQTDTLLSPILQKKKRSSLLWDENTAASLTCVKYYYHPMCSRW